MKMKSKIAFVVMASLLVASPMVLAEDAPRTIDMTIVLNDGAGKPLKDFADQAPSDPACEKCAALTVGSAIDHALKARFPDEQSLPGEQSWARALLGDRIKRDKAAKLTVKEAETVERVVFKAYNGQVIEQIVPVIDPNRRPPELQ